MNRSMLAVRTTNLTIAEGTFEIRTPATTRCRVVRIEIEQATATAQSLGFGNPAANGVTPTGILFQRCDPGDPASLINGAIAWSSTKPTAPSIFHARWNSAANIGEGIIWDFGPVGGIICPISDTLTVHNITASVANDITCVIDE